MLLLFLFFGGSFLFATQKTALCSPDQVAHALFTTLRIVVPESSATAKGKRKKNTAVPSTSEDVLQLLVKQYSKKCDDHRNGLFLFEMNTLNVVNVISDC
jgi:hypothetical protein